jgi:hypothetical protein
MTNKVAWGSATAKGGFKNEKEICRKFNNWSEDNEAKEWLKTMGYSLNEILKVDANTLPSIKGKKTDIVVSILLKSGLKKEENISVKKIKRGADYNQVDKRWVKEYQKLWNLPDDITKILKIFTGEGFTIRIYFNDIPIESRNKIINFFKDNKEQIVSDLVKGRENHQPNWILVTETDGKSRWVLRDIDSAIKIFSSGDITITDRGNLRIGRIIMQRKGGDAGRPTANMLQFKIHPSDLF